MQWSQFIQVVEAQEKPISIIKLHPETLKVLQNDSGSSFSQPHPSVAIQYKGAACWLDNQLAVDELRLVFNDGSKTQVIKVG